MAALRTHQLHSSSVVELIYTVSQSENIAVVDIMTESDYVSALKNNKACAARRMYVPRSLFEIAFIFRYVECRVSETSVLETFRTWKEIREARVRGAQLSEKRSIDEEGSSDFDRELLAFIIPPFYFRHQGCPPSMVESLMSQAARTFESDPDFNRLLCRLNNDIVSQFLRSDIGRDILLLSECITSAEGIEYCISFALDYIRRIQSLTPRIKSWVEAGFDSLGSSVACTTDDIIISVLNEAWNVPLDVEPKPTNGVHEIVSSIMVAETRHALDEKEGRIVLFRAANSGGEKFDDTLTWMSSERKHYRSISLGSSVFAGALFDRTACVWHLHQNQDAKFRNLRVLSLDLSDPQQRGMVYLPGLTTYEAQKIAQGDATSICMHPLSQLAAMGELFHPRTKCYIDSSTSPTTEKSMVSGMHHTSIEDLPYCLRADVQYCRSSVPTYKSASEVETVWNELSGSWRSLPLSPENSSFLRSQAFRLHRPLPCKIYAGSLSLRASLGWDDRVSECRRAGIILPYTSPKCTGLNWLYRHWLLYSRVSEIIPNTTSPLKLFPHEISQKVMECIGDGETGLVFSVLAGVGLRPMHRLRLLAQCQNRSMRWMNNSDNIRSFRIGSVNVNAVFLSSKYELLLKHINGSSVDVLVLQECPLKVAEKLSKDANFPFYEVAPASYLNNAVLSRLPFQNCMKIQLSPLPGCSHEVRSSVVCTVNLSVMQNHERIQIPVRIIATHLCHLSESNRLCQIKQLLEHSCVMESQPLNSIVVGDLNAVTRSDYEDTSWADNDKARILHGLERAKTDVSKYLQDKNFIDAATGLQLGSPALIHGLDIEGTSKVDTRVDYILCANGLTGDVSTPSWQIKPVPASYAALETGATDHKMISVTMEAKWSP